MTNTRDLLGSEPHEVFLAGADLEDTLGQVDEFDDRLIVNLGPTHPSSHGVLRLILELEGETVTEARAGIGYLHTGIEKNLEFRTWTQGTTFVTRMDYLSPLFNEAAYVFGVEQLLGIQDEVPEKARSSGSCWSASWSSTCSS